MKIYPQWAHPQSIHIHQIYTELSTQITDIQSPHTNTNSTSGLILSSSLAGQDENPLVRVDTPISIHAHTTESQEGVRKEFNKKTGQRVFIRHRT